ncbi:unnamed protein product [Urochloa humidicola]
MPHPPPSARIERPELWRAREGRSSNRRRRGGRRQQAWRTPAATGRGVLDPGRRGGVLSLGWSAQGGAGAGGARASAHSQIDAELTEEDRRSKRKGAELAEEERQSSTWRVGGEVRRMRGRMVRAPSTAVAAERSSLGGSFGRDQARARLQSPADLARSAGGGGGIRWWPGAGRAQMHGWDGARRWAREVKRGDGGRAGPVGVALLSSGGGYLPRAVLLTNIPPLPCSSTTAACAGAAAG